MPIHKQVNRMKQQKMTINRLQSYPDKQKYAIKKYKVYDNELKKRVINVHQYLLDSPGYNDYKTLDQKIINASRNLNENIRDNPNYKNIEQRINKLTCKLWNPKCWFISKEERVSREAERLRLLKQLTQLKMTLELEQKQSKLRVKYNNERYKQEKAIIQNEARQTQRKHGIKNTGVRVKKLQEAVIKLKNNTAKKPGILKGTNTYKARNEQFEKAKPLWIDNNKAAATAATAAATNNTAATAAATNNTAAPKNTANNVIANKTPESGQESMTTA